MTPLDEHGVEGEVAVEVEDSSSMSLLLNELPDDMREQVGGRVDPQVFLHAPLLGEEVVPLRLDLSSLAEVPLADSIQPSGHGVDGEVLSLTNVSHGGEVQLKLLQPVPWATAPTVRDHHLLLIPTLPDRKENDAILLASQVHLDSHVMQCNLPGAFFQDAGFRLVVGEVNQRLTPLLGRLRTAVEPEEN